MEEDSDVDLDAVSVMDVHLQVETLTKDVKQIKRHHKAIAGLTNLAYRFARSKTVSNTFVEPEQHHILEALVDVIVPQCLKKIHEDFDTDFATKEELTAIKKESKAASLGL